MDTPSLSAVDDACIDRQPSDYAHAAVDWCPSRQEAGAIVTLYGRRSPLLRAWHVALTAARKCLVMVGFRST